MDVRFPAIKDGDTTDDWHRGYNRVDLFFCTDDALSRRRGLGEKSDGCDKADQNDYITQRG